MRFVDKMRDKLEGLIQAVNRYPLTMVFLVAIAVVNVLLINNDLESYYRYLFAFLIGAVLSAVGQQIYERFFTKTSERILLMGGAVLLTILYYFVIGSVSIFNTENGTKTAVIMFAGIMAFIWVPSIKSRINFNDVFMATFKAFFTTVLFTTVIAGGVSLIIFATDSLLFNVGDKTIPHILSLIFSLFAPIFFLSFTPRYPGKNDGVESADEHLLREEHLEKAIACPRNLEVLISYIIIPLTAIYTIILLIYVLVNITSDFWTKNLMEPLLVSYAITVIIVYILSSTVENKFTSLFRKVFPKVLIPIVFFQTLASILKINEMGITHGRYYVILFGIFAIIAALIFSLVPIQKNGMIVAVLILFSAISIIPPIDAFTVSRHNQTNILEEVLVENKMLENNQVLPNESISIEDKITITRTVQYLNSMNYAEKVTWLPKDIWEYDKFNKTFGFNEVYDSFEDPDSQSQYAYLELGENPFINIEGFDFMTSMNTNNSYTEEDLTENRSFEKNGVTYLLTERMDEGHVVIGITNENDEELITIHTQDIFAKIFGQNKDRYVEKNNMLSIEMATLSEENDKAKINILVNSAGMYENGYDADFTVFIHVK